MIDPMLFSFGQRIEQKVGLVDMLHHYMNSIEPNLCKVTFYYPKYSEEILGTRRAFFPTDDITNINEPPESVLTDMSLPEEILALEEDFSNFTRVLNESITLAVQNKCLYFVTPLDIPEDVRVHVREGYGLIIVSYEDLVSNIEIFLQGFYNYYKFSSPIYGIDSPNLAHQMIDGFINKKLHPFESLIHSKGVSDSAKEKVRSFNHNRYPDLLVARDQILFFKIQQQLDAVRKGIFNSVNPRFHSSIIYHLNFYYYLLYGAIDHLAWITNDILDIGYSLENGRMKVGFKVTQNKNRAEFISRLQEVDEILHSYITSDTVQEWLFFLGEVRNQSAHREVMTAGPLTAETPESKMTDAEIDAIIYAKEPPIPADIVHMFPEGFEENKRIQDRQAYRISKMKVVVEHIAVVEKDGEQYTFNPLERMAVDMGHLNEMIENVIQAYTRKVTPEPINEAS